MKELWKDIPGYETLYQASNLGQVKSLDRKNRRGYNIKGVILGKGNKGYNTVSLCRGLNKKIYNTHQIIAITFLNHTPCGHRVVVDHIDGDKHNNKISNLQLISQRENSSKDKKGGSSKYIGVHWHKYSNSWTSQIRINGKIKSLGYFEDEDDAGQAYQKALIDID
jgi:hypothetical protein